MKRFPTCLFIFFLFGQASDWPMFHHDLGHTGYSTDTGVDAPIVTWTFKTRATYNSFGGMRLSSPAVVDNMVFIGRSLTSGHYAACVFTSEGVAYVGENVDFPVYPGHGFRIIDVSDPTSPIELGYYDVGVSVSDVRVSGDYAYLAATSNGLVILDISMPSSPDIVGTYNTPDRAFDLYLDNGYAFIADGGGGLQIIDVTVPSSPTLAGSYNPGGYVSGVWVAGDYAYLADRNYGLRIFDVSIISSPVPVGSLTTRHWAMDVMIDGDYAYIADGDSGLVVANVVVPTSPFEEGFYDTPGRTFEVFVTGDYAYVADGYNGLRVVDISIPSVPTEVGFYDEYWTQNLSVFASYAYLATGQGGVRVVDASTVSSPNEMGYYDYPDDVFCIDATTGAEIWGVPALGPVASSPAVTSDRVYFGTASPDMSVCCFDRASGQQVWRYKTDGQIMSSPAVAYNKVFICSFDSCLYCLDADTGSLIWKVAIGLMPHTSPAVYQGRVFAADGVPFGPPANFTCVDTSGSVIWQYTVGSGIGASPTVVDGRMYGSSDDGYIYCLNAMTDNSAGELIWATPIGGNFATPAVWNNRVFTVNDALISGLMEDYYVFCIDATDGSYIWQYDLTPLFPCGSGSSPAVAGGKVYLGLDAGGWIICLDATTDNPDGELVWSYQLPNNQRTDCSPAIVDEWLYIASRDSFVYAIQDANPSVSELHYSSYDSNVYLDVYPNPVHSATNIRCHTQEAWQFKENVELKIYDINGRLVRCIPLTAETVSWNATDDNGCRLNTGVYFIYLSIKKKCINRKIVLLK